jgi:protein-disulfide isomerase
MSSSAAGRAVLVGLAAVGALGAGQMLHEPRTFDVTPLASLPAGPEAARRVGPANPTASVLASAPPESNSSASISVQHPGSAALASRELALHGGAFRLDLKTLPLLGLEDAPQTIVSLFDYTCSHCRQLHRPLMEAYRSLSSRLAIVSLPVPVDPLCNPLTKHPVPEQTNGCTYARLGLAVWRANRQQLEAFDDWMFSFPRPPSTNEVRARAESLVGAANLAKALADPWIEDLIRMDIRLYHTNYLVYRKSRLPQLIIGTNLVVGVARSPEDIYRLLSGQPGFVAPNLARATNVPAATR